MSCHKTTAAEEVEKIIAESERQEATDVRHQSHYEDQSIQPIEYMQATLSPEEFRGFLKANVIKYVSRAERKNGVEDYEKALVYAGWLVTAAKGEKVKP